MLGYQNSTNYYYMNFSGVSGATALYKVVNGVASVVTGGSVSGTIIANTSAHEIKITRVGQAISVWYDGNQLLSNVLDSTFIGGKIGLAPRPAPPTSTTSRLDNTRLPTRPYRHEAVPKRGQPRCLVAFLCVKHIRAEAAKKTSVDCLTAHYSRDSS